MKKATVFLSYSHADREFVDGLADQLKASGVDVWIDKWMIKVGDSIIQKINEGISASDFLIVVLTGASVNSKWVREELDAATIRNVEEEKHAFILPVLLEECEIPTLLQHRKYANFKDDPEQAFQDLLEVIRPGVRSLSREAMSKRRALITGITDQDGSYLAEYLLSKGYEVLGMVEQTTTINFDRIQHFQNDVTILQGDLVSQSSLGRILREYQPQEVYNLAPKSHVLASFEQPVATAQRAALGVTRMLEAICTVDPEIRFYQASSSEMFGKVLEVPQRETTTFYPRSPYGVAKVYGYWITVIYRESYNLFACSGIPFNHESPRRGLEFVTHKVTYGAANIKLGLADELRLGNLEAQRDWGYIGDYVEAMWLMLQQDEPDDYVIATGETHSVREWCEVTFDYLGLDYRDYVVSDPKFYRPWEADQLVGDASKARRELGWEPRVSFEELIHMMVDADMEAVQKMLRTRE